MLIEFFSQVTYVNIAVKNQTFPVVIVIWKKYIVKSIC